VRNSFKKLLCITAKFHYFRLTVFSPRLMILYKCQNNYFFKNKKVTLFISEKLQNSGKNDLLMMYEQDVEEVMQGGCVITFIFLEKNRSVMCRTNTAPFTSHVIEKV